MNRRLKVRLTDSAKQDLLDSFDYSASEWGIEHATYYRDLIRKRLHSLALHPEIGVSREDVFPGCRGLIVGQLVVYYVVEANDAVIVRIVDQRREPKNLFSGGERPKLN